MDNSLLSMNLEQNFTYHEVLTDSDNAVKDIAKLLALGVESEEIREEKTILKAATPVIDECWEVVYPKIDRADFSDKVEDWNNLLPEEYKIITNAKIDKIKDTVILKTKTIPKEITVNNSTAMGVNQDLNMPSVEMYLEIYMPPYLCDSEAEDPLRQRTGSIPKVNDINGIANGNTRVARNYHHLFMRIFDNLNEEGNAPAENVIDSVTRDVIKWNSRSSCWSKLSWYTDFEDKFKAPLTGLEARGMQDGTVRVPVIAGLTSQSKIKLWANVNASRVVLGTMGSPNVDFSDNRYLIGCAYIGQIDSFDFSINDTAGNFGLFCTSSTSPAMGKTEVKIRPSVPAAILNNSGNNVTPGTNGVGSGTRLNFTTDLSQATKLQMFNPATNYDVQAIEISSIPYDYTQVEGGDYWGDRYIDTSTINLYCSFDNQPIAVIYNDKNKNQIRRDIGIAQSVTITPSKVEIDSKDRKKVKITLTVEDLLKAFIGETETALAMQGSGINFKYCYYSGGYYSQRYESTATLNIQYNFSYYTEYTVQTGGVKRDKFGNPVSAVLDTTYGKNTANGITDFAMYATFTKDYFQRHFFMFASTEEYMQKELYGKSSYTGEYFADRIKVVHSSEGPRGILSGMITIDTSSLYPFDELIVNKDFEKYTDKPEELYVYLPVTAPYCPFSNSPNGRHGIGILKEIRYKEPVTDEEIVKFAANEIDRKYKDLKSKYVKDDFSLITLSEYGSKIEWAASQDQSIKDTLITIEGDETAKIKTAKVHRPGFNEALKDSPEATLTATITHGDAKNTYKLKFKVKMEGMVPSKAMASDVSDLDKLMPKETKVNIVLPSKGKYGSDIKWSAKNPEFISDTGIIVRPDSDKNDGTAVLTATITNSTETPEVRNYPITVPHWTKEEEVQDAKQLITWDLIKGKNTNSQSITENLELKNEVGRHVSLVWSVPDKKDGKDDDKITTGKLVIDSKNEAGIITRPTHIQGPVLFQIKCTLSKDGADDTSDIGPFIMEPNPITNEEIVNSAYTLLEAPLILGDSGNKDLLQITNNMKLPYKITNDNASSAKIVWNLATKSGSDYTRVDTNDSIKLTDAGDYCQANITRPLSGKGNVTIALQSTISCNGFVKNKFFDITILALS